MTENNTFQETREGSGIYSSSNRHNTLNRGGGTRNRGKDCTSVEFPSTPTSLLPNFSNSKYPITLDSSISTSSNSGNNAMTKDVKRKHQQLDVEDYQLTQPSSLPKFSSPEYENNSNKRRLTAIPSPSIQATKYPQDNLSPSQESPTNMVAYVICRLLENYTSQNEVLTKNLYEWKTNGM